MLGAAKQMEQEHSSSPPEFRVICGRERARGQEASFPARAEMAPRGSGTRYTNKRASGLRGPLGRSGRSEVGEVGGWEATRWTDWEWPCRRNGSLSGSRRSRRPGRPHCASRVHWDGLPVPSTAHAATLPSRGPASETQVAQAPHSSRWLTLARARRLPATRVGLMTANRCDGMRPTGRPAQVPLLID